ncbi:hypothetical protein QO010_001959 [Caulobacter ginsengisoli]|uniref:Uncharacterized protein n=1 Tax=Caulobacter ginsengisoli TaxID=400775 RepID=A0ABU0IQ94_9CAUL|nr:hypothetical protein [Caulobacter ginsengisoli]MDQ0464178.1 hypothetical protein [Caulobacter ginsengisoli]
MKRTVAVLLAGVLSLAGLLAVGPAVAQNVPKAAPGKGPNHEPSKKEEKLTPMTFRLVTNGQDCADCTWIAADGDIVYETGKTFEAFLKTQKIQWSVLVRFNSGGGSLPGGVDLGRAIRKAKLRTAIGETVDDPKVPGKASYKPGLCASACAYAFLGGISRTVDTGSLYGVHQFHNPEVQNDQDVQTVVAVLGYYVVEMGIKPELLLVASSTHTNDIIWLEPEQMEALDVVTSRQGLMDAQWTLAPFGDGLGARTTQIQADGSAVTFALTCKAGEADRYVVYVIRDTYDLNSKEIATTKSAIRGLSFLASDKPVGGVLETHPIVARSKLTLGAGLPKSTARLLIDDGGELKVQVSAPAALDDYLNGGRYHFPVANLNRLLPYLDRNCFTRGEDELDTTGEGRGKVGR